MIPETLFELLPALIIPLTYDCDDDGACGNETEYTLLVIFAILLITPWTIVLNSYTIALFILYIVFSKP